MNEKQLIEKDTAELFLRHYNAEFGRSYSVVSCGDAPDILCKDKQDDELQLEITLTEDKDEDIAAALGRSDTRSVEALHSQLGQGNPMLFASCLTGNVLDNLVNTIEKKLHKDYGTNVALVVRSVSGCCWSWNSIKDTLQRRLDLSSNPFDRGIWLVDLDGSELVNLVP